LLDLIIQEGVTFAAGVPTVWLGVLEQINCSGKVPGKLRRIVSGGAAVPGALIERYAKHGVAVIQAWGMTELSPLGTVNASTSASEQLPPDKQAVERLKQGRPVFGVQLRIRDETGCELPRDGATSGFLEARGYWVCSRYFGETEQCHHSADGWFETGDVATIDSNGFMQIVDRQKDLIKSGGEWISSVVLENLAMEHPAVAEAAAVGEPHEKWQERPLLVVVLRMGASASAEELLALYQGRVASWWIPDRVVFLDELPHTATGKISKRALRAQLEGTSSAGS
jgi:3-(methylthio)propionyl---CoA ligase